MNGGLSVSDRPVVVNVDADPDAPLVVLTGARGFIGAPARAALRASGRVLLRTAGRQGADLPLDLADPAPLRLPAGVHTLVHLAGETRDAARMDAVNLHGARRLAEAAAQAGVRHLVHLSSVGVYGAPPHSGTVGEDHRRTPQGPYETSKDAGERALRERCQALGLRCTVLQPATVIGHVPGGRRSLLGLMQGVVRGRYRAIGSPAATVNYVGVADVAAAIDAVVRDGLAAQDASASVAARIWIVNTPCALADLVSWVADTLGCPVPRGRLPLWAGQALVGAGAVLTRLGRTPPLSRAQLLELSNTTRFDGDAITRALGWRYPQGIEATVRSLARDYRAQGWL
jgi:dihydroflavonol-4-reductase